MTDSNTEWLQSHDDSTSLHSMLLVIDDVIRQRPTNLALLKDAMGLLFTFLSSPEGRTDANCRYADSFLMRGIEDDAYWAHLPEPFQAVLWDAGGQLHDTVTAPKVARNFESTPEQLLERTRGLSF